MDCAAEEQLLRMKLEMFPEIKQLDFDLDSRTLSIYHQGRVGPIGKAIAELNLNEKLISTQESILPKIDSSEKQRNVLWWVLGINFGFFLLEMIFGWLSNSMGLVADSLDMLADAFVYGLSLFVVGSAFSFKKRIAGMSGYIQMSLAILGFLEIVRRFIGYSDVPEFKTMIIVATMALIANGISLRLIQTAKSDEPHMKASYIFTSNDIIINIGIIIAGVLVYLTTSRIPDLVIGTIVFIIVIRGAFRILSLAK